jgi:hypothetical protein
MMVTLRNLILVSSRLLTVTLAPLGAFWSRRNWAFIRVSARQRAPTSYNV